MTANLTIQSATHNMFFFFNDTATTEIYTLSLHDALPISRTVKVIEHRKQIASFVVQSCGFEKMLETEFDHSKTRSEEHTSELQSPCNLVCRLLLEKKN